MTRTEPTPDDRIVVSPVGGRRIEISLAVAMSIFGVLFSVQTIPTVLQQWASIATPAGIALLVLVSGAVVVAGLASVLRQWTTQIFLGAAAVYLLAELVWPLTLSRPLTGGAQPWLFEVSTVAAGFVIVAIRSWTVPTLYAVVTTGVLGLLRTTTAGGSVSGGRALLDACYALILDLALLVLTIAVRQAAAAVDSAQSAAIHSYARAQIDEATESERVQTDALVHDSVLTTFISAARSDTPESQRLSARMAVNAMRILTQAQLAATRDRASAVPVDRVVTLVRQEAGDAAAAFDFVQGAAGDGTLPLTAVEALTGAAVQAMVNSVNHAGADVHRRVAVDAAGGGVRIVVEDDGRGFDVAAQTTVRLGVRVSILERVRLAGGAADIESAPGAGTRITLVWPAAAVGAAPVADRTEVPA